mmetsp:Transcript_9291/g.22850  ORF Transcript_9291/g.22850 Transcript_9291/m.22850 type:complete len:345 (-) Transcript_9291:183-1217(-)
MPTAVPREEEEETFQEIYNFRDLGGRPCGDGSQTKPGVIFRSANTSFATGSDVKKLVECYQIKTILDFRAKSDPSQVGGTNLLDDVFPEVSEDEAKSKFDGRRRIRLKIINRKMQKAILGQGHKVYVVMYILWSIIGKMAGFAISFVNWIYKTCMGLDSREKIRNPSPTLAALRYPFELVEVLAISRKMHVAFLDLKSMGKLYTLFLGHGGDRFFEALKICASKQNQPVLFHCSSGKDRAGLTAFLLLRACGVPLEECFADYTDSQKWTNMDAHFNQISGGRGDIFRYFATAELCRALSAPTDYIKEANDFLEKRYGGAINYLDSIGFDEAWREKLKEQFVQRK